MKGYYVSSQSYNLWAMKTRAGILIVIWSLLLIEPVSANFSFESNYSSCKKIESSIACCSSSCSQPAEEEDDNKDCEANRCNPLMSCPTGNFYTISHHHLSIDALKQSKEKQALINDNRIIKRMTDCWHPPEII